MTNPEANNHQRISAIFLLITWPSAKFFTEGGIFKGVSFCGDTNQSNMDVGTSILDLLAKNCCWFIQQQLSLRESDFGVVRYSLSSSNDGINRSLLSSTFDKSDIVFLPDKLFT